MIHSLVPPGAVVVGSDDVAPATAVLPDEALIVARAVPARQREFAAGRACARVGLAALGWPGFAILAGSTREPLWPPGILGSITHCPGYCAAALSPSGLLLGLGIDAERNVVLDARLHRRVAHPGELRGPDSGPLGSVGVADVAVLVFSAKEAFYKAWFPMTRVQLDFLDVFVGLDFRRRTFDVRLPASVAAALPEGGVIRGRWATTASHIFTVTTVEDGPDHR